jgi:hypothetical protein
MANRDTSYATELATAAHTLPGGDEARIERLFVKKQNQDEIRFSWWREGKMANRPLDLSEEDLLATFRAALKHGVFTDGFIAKLAELLANR